LGVVNIRRSAASRRSSSALGSAMTFTSINNLNHDPELARALGDMVIAWARADTTLVMSLSAITGAPMHMAELGYYRIPSFEARVKMLRAMIPEWQNNNADALEKALGKLNNLAHTRNGWVHNCWVISKEDNKTFCIDFRKDPSNRSKPVKASDVRHHAESVISRVTEIEDLVIDFVPGLALLGKDQ
jgi:hypothetical protein